MTQRIASSQGASTSEPADPDPQYNTDVSPPVLEQCCSMRAEAPVARRPCPVCDDALPHGESLHQRLLCSTAQTCTADCPPALNKAAAVPKMQRTICWPSLSVTDAQRAAAGASTACSVRGRQEEE